ncbi:MAG: hypothetical protein ACRERU_14680 [Methylococcales bacterium]
MGWKERPRHASEGMAAENAGSRRRRVPRIYEGGVLGDLTEVAAE